MAYTFTAYTCHLTKKLQCLFACKRQKANMIFERRYVQHVTVSNFTLSKGSPYATHVIYSKVRLLLKSLTTPNQNIG